MRPGAPRSDARAAVALAHRWLGLVVGALFVVTGLTGTALAYAPEILRALYPPLAVPLDDAWVGERAAVLGRIEAAHPGAVTLVRFPTAALPAYEVYLADESQAYFDPVNGIELVTREPYGDLLMLSHDLHIHLLAGEAGERVLGWFGIAMMLIVLTGAWLWWPRRGMWRIATRYPAVAPSRVRWLWWHKTVGAVTTPVLWFVTVSGFAIIFYAPTQALLTGLFGGDPPAAAAPAPPSVATDWPAVLATLDAALPDGRTVFYYPGDALTFRKQMPGELHPNGRSVIRIAGDGRLVSAIDATESALGQRMTNSLYPLHSGRAGSEAWRFVVALTGLLPLAFFVTGIYTWLVKYRGAKSAAPTSH